MQIIRLLFVGAAIALVGGCASSGVAPSSLGLYGDVAGSQSVKGSSSQHVINRAVPYTADEARDAAETTLFRKGLNVEENNAQKGRITASGGYGVVCDTGPCDIQVTVAIYVKQTSPKPSTQVTIVVDRHTLMGHGILSVPGENKVANDIVSEMQKILTTYR